MNPYGRNRRRPEPYDGRLKSQYLYIDFPYWVKHLPFETFWNTRSLRDNIQAMMAATEELLIKATKANLTLDGLDPNGDVHFSAKEWVLWLIQGTTEMNVNHIKRNYLEVLRSTFNTNTQANDVRVHVRVLDNATIRYIENEVNRLCP